MQIDALTALQQATPVKTEKTPGVGQTLNFGDVLAQALDKLNQVQGSADELAGKFIAGGITDLHQVTIAMQEAKLSLQLAVEVRNKIVEAYQEVMRMQV